MWFSKYSLNVINWSRQTETNIEVVVRSRRTGAQTTYM